ncbi:MAG TPA: phosphate ABC transporter permease PtsA [Firmicutes bacterium]|jgi:phosphate transport system permease protein|nr:phosphate ABC transporter permease PtsA [Bacillota bacterium]HBE07279.1 phosphate ABC transporter permease PtsA [Bacillota bacterium]HBG43446.1 phosphate ABC transporter permease PtsA [Bacillota bacterium]HBL50802.1 phosphate ABC transporter permease PtsA [Bacillota bacterium]HBR25094.1 phosphate ABC transporter permease PtsA [Bacillota bacterium]
MKKRNLAQRTAFLLIGASAVITFALFALILGYVLIKGMANINWEFLTTYPALMGREGGIFPTIIGTLVLTGVALLIAVPLGVAAAIYLSEYTKGGIGIRIIRFAIESLAGIPSIIYGLFGFAFLVTFLKLGFSVLSGAIALALMVLPIIIRTTEEAIRTVPDDYRQASLALGATRWQTTSRVVLPAALPGVVTAVMLASGRAVGETAAVWLTAGGALKLPFSLHDPTRPMTLHLYYLAAEGLSLERAYATAAVLLVLVLVVYSLAIFFRQKFGMKRR